MYDAIARGNHPAWILYLQVMTIQEARKYPRNPFDITKTWREEDVPYIPVGKMVLNRNPSNFFAHVEQAAFAPSNMVPEIEPSPDRMLAARLFSYQDGQRYRLGVNFPKLDVNRPVAEVNTYQRDGFMCYGDNENGSPNYFPNSYGGLVADTQGAGQVSFGVEGIVDRYDIPDDEYSEPRRFLDRDVDPAERKRMVAAIVDRLRLARREVRERTLQNIFYPISKEFGDEVRAALLHALSESDSRPDQRPELDRISLGSLGSQDNLRY